MVARVLHRIIYQVGTFESPGAMRWKLYSQDRNMRWSIIIIVVWLANSQWPSVDAQVSHPEAEKALDKIVLEKDFGEQLKFHSRQVVTTKTNAAVPGLNGLMFIRWKGDSGATEVMASIQWFEKQDDLLKFYEQSKQRDDFQRREVDGSSLWTIGTTAYQWTDNAHFHIGLGGQPDPPREMLAAFLKLIPSRVEQAEQELANAVPPTPQGGLKHGYRRRGNVIYSNNQRIDQAGADDIDAFAKAVGHKLKLASNVDADSFRVLSREYTCDKNSVYYRWISPGRFWIVEVPGADPKTFRAVGFELAKDAKHVWIRDSIVPGADPTRVKSIFDYRIWLDANSVWNGSRRIDGADPETFERIGTSEFGYYRDKNKVYSYFGRLKVVEGADPATFQIPRK